ncbi:hypothetical protein DERP_012431 [Dermatophagoides pteronyssinus]|uniref:Uncharacterized protein n=1 Tax=Dermatophagoides pteronyssinus TaxID=6956 RepID=A0ABQ8IWY7_DERPT|nr:hypothetical protein DERP_012431 [Dermatophagoides pteronyssinus]
MVKNTSHICLSSTTGKQYLPISTTVPKGFRNFFAEINQPSHDDHKITYNTPRHSTALISFTPFDSSDPLFGPFEPEESLEFIMIKKNEKKSQTID